MGRLIGYARTSTEEQNLRMQIQALDEAGCNMIFSDQIGGAERTRPELERALAVLEEGDTFVFWKIDRVGRSSAHVIELIEELSARGVKIKSLTEPFDTTTPAGEAFLGIVAVIAQMERKIAAERRQAGIEAARKEGKHLGRPSLMSPEKLEAAVALLESGMLMKDISKVLEMSPSTLKRMLSAGTTPEAPVKDKRRQRVKPKGSKKRSRALAPTHAEGQTERAT